MAFGCVPFRLGDGVFALLAQPMPRDNIGVIFGSDTALIIDAGITPTVGRMIQMRGIKQLFSEKEIAYLKSQRLARIGTVSPDGEPDVAPVGFTFDGEHFLIGSLDIRRTLKYKNAMATGRAALVIDDLTSTDPLEPRGIKLHGKARITQAEGYAGAGEYIEITPDRYWSWGIEAPAFDHGKPVMKKAGSIDS